VKDPYDKAFEIVESQGSFAPDGTQNEIMVKGCHPERSEGSLFWLEIKYIITGMNRHVAPQLPSDRS
jgi:hypothetical protein